MDYKSEDEAKRIYNLLTTPEDTKDKNLLNKKSKVLNLLAYEIIEDLAINGVKIDKIDDVLKRALEIPITKKYIHVNKCFKAKARARANSCLCGSNEKLTIHHIKGVRNYPELRYRVDNTIILCNTCHNFIHRDKSIIKEV